MAPRLGGKDFGEFKSVSLAVSDLDDDAASGLQSGMALVVQWTDTNTGTQPASGSFSDQIVITNTTTGDVLATGDVLYNAASLGNLAAGASVTQEFTTSASRTAARASARFSSPSRPILTKTSRRQPASPTTLTR